MSKSTERHEFLKSLPKCEHHVHIEGTLEPKLMFELARRNGVTLPPDDPAFESEAALRARYQRFETLAEFLYYYELEMTVLVTAADFEELAWAYFERSASDGLAHAEFSFDIQLHLERGVSLVSMLAGLTAARNRAQNELGISSNLICCFTGQLPASSALAILDDRDMQNAISEGRVTGIGLVASEENFPAKIFKQVFAKAKSLGLRRTAHAGEEGPASNIQAAVSELDAERIDHGISLCEDVALMTQIARLRTALTICPISNVRLRAVPSYKSLPIRTFLNAGVRFSVNSDDPSYFGSYILDNCCAVQDAFDLRTEEWEIICMNAIDASWCSSERKTELQKQLQDVMKKFP